MSEISPPPLPLETSSPCQGCGAPELSATSRLPICEPCRMSMVRHAFPWWLKAAAVLVIGLAAYSIKEIPTRLTAAIAFHKAENSAAKGRWQEAFERYQPFAKAVPDDTELQITFAEAAANSGHYYDAAATLDRLAGRSVSKDLMSRANDLNYQLRKAIQAESAVAR